MSTVTLTPEEFEAMEGFNICHNDDDFDEKVRLFVTWSKSWENTYLPLKHMGLEKFVKCLLNGYEVDEPNFNFNEMNVSLNLGLKDLQRTPDLRDPIYIKIAKGSYKGLSINEAEFLIESLQETVKFLKNNVDNIGGR